MFIPEEKEITITPIARDPVEISATAASPFILLSELIFNKKKALKTTTGMATASGAALNATAMDNAPNPTCERPSPTIENRFRTRLTPNKDAHRDIKIPTITALDKNVYENISTKKSIMVFLF